MGHSVADHVDGAGDGTYTAMVVRDGTDRVADVRGPTPDEARRLAGIVAAALNEPDEALAQAGLRRLALAARDGGQWLPESPVNPHRDADSVAVFIGHRARRAGLRYRFVAAADRANQPFHHVFVEVWYSEAETWLPLDPLASSRYWGRRVAGEIEGG